MADADVFTPDDIGRSDVLGPAYFAAWRAAKAIMQGTVADPFKVIVKKCVDDLQSEMLDYAADYILADIEQRIQDYIREMVERTVRALLTGEQWAINQYPLSKYHDGEKIRAAVAKHGGDPLLMARIKELEAQLASVTDTLRYYRDR